MVGQSFFLPHLFLNELEFLGDCRNPHSLKIDIDMEVPSGEIAASLVSDTAIQAIVNDWATTFSKEESGLNQFTHMLRKDDKVDVASCFFRCYKV